MLNSRALEKHKWFLFVAPALLVYTVLFILPSLSSFYYSLTDWDGISSSFVGLDNYKKMLHDDAIIRAIGNTFFYAVFLSLIQNSFGLILAVLMNRKFLASNILRVILFMPAIFSSLVLSYVWGFMLEPNIGAMNSMLQASGLGFLKHDWLGDPVSGRWMIVIYTAWQYMGQTMVIYLAGLQSIPMELYEACEIDGAGGWRKFIHITFPMIAPATTLTLTLSTIGGLKLFDPIFALTKGGPANLTHNISTKIFDLAFGGVSRWGYGTAMSIMLFVFIMVLTAIQVTLLRRREVQM